MAGLVPLAFIAAGMVSCFSYSSEAWTSPALVIFLIGPFFSLCCTRIIIASVSKTPFDMFEHFHLSMPMVISIMIFPLNAHFHFASEFTLYICLILMGLCSYFWYTLHAIGQITEYLDIYCLTIKHKKKVI